MDLEQQYAIASKIAKYILERYLDSNGTIGVDKSVLDHLNVTINDMSRTLKTWETDGYIHITNEHINEFMPRWSINLSSFGINELNKITSKS